MTIQVNLSQIKALVRNIHGELKLNNEDSSINDAFNFLATSLGYSNKEAMMKEIYLNERKEKYNIEWVWPGSNSYLSSVYMTPEEAQKIELLSPYIDKEVDVENFQFYKQGDLAHTIEEIIQDLPNKEIISEYKALSS